MCWDSRRDTMRALSGGFMVSLSLIAIEDYRRGEPNLARTAGSLESLKKYFRSARNGHAIIMARDCEDPYHMENFDDAAQFLELHGHLLKDNPYPFAPSSPSNLLREFENVVDGLLELKPIDENQLKNLEHFLKYLSDYYHAQTVLPGCC